MNTYAYRALASVVALVVTVVLVLSMSLSSHAGEITCEVSALGNSPNLQVVCYDEDGDLISYRRISRYPRGRTDPGDGGGR